MTTPSDGALGAQLAVLKTIFRPSSPINDQELFHGRTEELARVIGAVQELGQHAVIYGERGIGKTSLAYMVQVSFRLAAPESSLAVRIPCSIDDNFANVWQKLIPRIVNELDLVPEDVRESIAPVIDRAEEILGQYELSPESVFRALHVLSSRLPVLIVLDEFDRIGDVGSRQLFADLIKTISDDLLPCTLVVIGVADDVDELIEGHRSVERALKQIAIPRMSSREISDIVVGGFETLARRAGVAIAIKPEVVSQIVQMSQGFPHYAHLLAGSMGEEALIKDASNIDNGIAATALTRALNETQRSIQTNYTSAVTSTSKNAQFRQTLLACALAEVDELGFFAPADVARPLSLILGSNKKAADFIHRLHKFTDEPSWILEERGEGRRTRYRFANPLMRPFVLIKGMGDGIIEVRNSRLVIKGQT